MLAATVWLNKLESETLFLTRSPNFFESPHVHLMILQHSIIFNPCVNANSLNVLGCRYFKQPLCFAGGRKLPSTVHARWLLRKQRLPRQTASSFPPIFLCRNGLHEIGICRNQARRAGTSLPDNYSALLQVGPTAARCRPFGPQNYSGTSFNALTDVATDWRSFGPVM